MDTSDVKIISTVSDPKRGQIIIKYQIGTLRDIKVIPIDGREKERMTSWKLWFRREATKYLEQKYAKEQEVKQPQ